MAVTLVLELGDLLGDGRGDLESLRAVDALCDRLCLRREPEVVAVGERQLGLLAGRDLDEGLREPRRALAAVGEVGADLHLHAEPLDVFREGLDLGVGVTREAVDAHDDGQAPHVADVREVALDVAHAGEHRLDVLRREVGDGHAALVLHRAHRRDEDDGVRAQASEAALEVDELLRAEVGAEAGLRHGPIGVSEGGLRRRHRVAAVRDVGERAAVDEGGVALERLDEVGRQRIGEKRRHGAVDAEVARGHGCLLVGSRDNDATEAFLEVVDRGGEAEDGHDLTGDDDVEAGFARHAVRRAPEADDDVAQRAVVHVEHAFEGDAARVDAERVALLQVVVEHRCEQVVCGGDGREVTGEVKVDVRHRVELGAPSAGGPALHPEDGPHARLTQRGCGGLADVGEPVDEAHRGGRLALTGGRRARGGDEHELASLASGTSLHIGKGDLGLVRAVAEDLGFGNADLRRDLLDGLHGGGGCNLDVAGHAILVVQGTMTFAGVSVAADATFCATAVSHSAESERGEHESGDALTVGDLTVRDEAHEAFPRHGTHDGDAFGLLLTGCPLGVLDTGRGLQARGEKDVLGGVAHSVECVHAPDFAPLAGRVAGLLDELTLRCEQQVLTVAAAGRYLE